VTTLSGPLFGTAADYLTRDVPVCSSSTTARDLRRSLVGRRFTTVDDIAVLEGDVLVGLVRIEDLLAAPDGVAVGEIMDTDPPTVGEGVDQEVVAWRAVARSESCLAVVDEGGRFLGVILPAPAPHRRRAGDPLHLIHLEMASVLVS